MGHCFNSHVFSTTSVTQPAHAGCLCDVGVGHSAYAQVARQFVFFALWSFLGQCCACCTAGLVGLGTPARIQCKKPASSQAHRNRIQNDNFEKKPPNAQSTSKPDKFANMTRQALWQCADILKYRALLLLLLLLFFCRCCCRCRCGCGVVFGGGVLSE